jgi:hypothetical protein
MFASSWSKIQQGVDGNNRKKWRVPYENCKER